METAVIHFIVLGVVSRLTTGAGVLPDVPLNAAVGQTVTFSPTLTPPGKPLVTVNWKFDQNKNIITFSGETLIAPEYEGRVTFSPFTGSLELRNVKLNDTGEYSISIIRQGEAAKNGVTTLRVYEPVSNVMLAASSTDLVEFNSSVTLTCSSSGSSLSFLWLNSSSEVTESDRVQLTDGGSTLTIVSVTRYDQGPFRCLVSNPVSNGSSSEVNLSISYGPDNVQITGPSEVHVGQAINLTCSAESNPSANYTWMLNGTEIHNSAVFTKNTPEPSDSGKYTCEVTNKITERTSSAVHVLSVTAIPVTTSGCSGGCIAGIVIAVLVILGAAGGGGYYVYRKKKQQKKPSNRNTATGPTRIEGHDNQTYSEELNYADIKFFKNKDGGTVQLGQQNNSEYAQIKVNNKPVVAHSPPTYDAHLQRPKREAPQPDVTQLYAKVNKNRASHT